MPRTRPDPSSKFCLRNAIASDRKFLYEVFRAAMKEYITQARGEWNEQREVAQFHRQLNISASKIIRVDGSDVGFISAPVSDGIVWIHTICILPEHQNHGIGSEIIQSVVAQAQKQKLLLHLSVLKVNPARRLYERLGFKVTQEAEHHYHMQFQGVPGN